MGKQFSIRKERILRVLAGLIIGAYDGMIFVVPGLLFVKIFAGASELKNYRSPFANGERLCYN